MIIKVQRWNGKSADDTVIINTDHVELIQPFLVDGVHPGYSQIILNGGARFVIPMNIEDVYKLIVRS